MMSSQEIKKPFTVWIAHIFVWILIVLALCGIIFNILRLFTEREEPNIFSSVIGGSSIAVIIVCVGWGLHKLIRKRRKIARPILGMLGIALTLFMVSSSKPPNYPVSHVYSTSSDVIQYTILIFGIGVSLMVGAGAKSRAYFTTLPVNWKREDTDQADISTDPNSD